MVFSTDTILNAKDINLSNPVLDDDEFDFDKSFFSEALDLIADEQYNFFKETNKLLDEGIVSNMVINSLKAIDINDVLSKIFQFFIDAIENLNNAFNAFLLNFMNKNVELKVAKNKLSRFNGSIRYNKPYYIYRNLDSNSSVIDSYRYTIDNIYSTMINQLSQVSMFKDKNDIIKALENARNNLELRYSAEDDTARKNIIGVPVSAEDFSSHLFNYFRSDQIVPNNSNTNDNIDANRVRVAFNDYYNSNKQISIVRRDQWKFKAEATALKVKIKTTNITRFVYKDFIFNSEVINSYNRIINSTCREIKNVCNIYVMFYSAKLDALKDYTKTNRDILFFALKKQVREGL